MPKSFGRSDSQVMACTYRLYDAAGRLLYAGVADDFDVRFKAHERKLWWKHVARKDVIWFDNRLDALYEESRAIALENPAHNRRPGISPIALRLTRVKDYWGRITPVNRPALAATRWDKDRIMWEVEHRKGHAAVLFEGQPCAYAVPLGWYLRACEQLGRPADVETMPAVHYETL